MDVANAEQKRAKNNGHQSIIMLAAWLGSFSNNISTATNEACCGFRDIGEFTHEMTTSVVRTRNKQTVWVWEP